MQCKTTGRLAVLALVMACIGAVQAQTARIPIRVVVVTTFELGEDSGDTPGEFQHWVERLPLAQTLPFPAGNRALRYNPDKQVLGIVVGSGAINAAASTMALGLDPRFDLSKAYWIIAGIAGVDPDAGSVGSAAWAEWVIDRDLAHEIDSREIPAGWTTGLIPLTHSYPFQPPPPPAGIFSPNAYHLDAGLVDWAYRLTARVALDDTADLKSVRAGYAGHPAALLPPQVMKGDEVSASNWWVGWIMTRTARDWMRYWTGGKGVAVTTAMEDHGVLRSLQMLGHSGLVDVRRALVLRTAAPCRFCIPRSRPRRPVAPPLICPMIWMPSPP